MDLPLTAAEMAAHLQRIRYKDGWTFEVYQGRWEGPHLVIRARVPDSNDPDRDIVLNIRSAIPPMADTTAFETWLAWRVQRVETHESREFLRRDGAPIPRPARALRRERLVMEWVIDDDPAYADEVRQRLEWFGIDYRQARQAAINANIGMRSLGYDPPPVRLPADLEATNGGEWIEPLPPRHRDPTVVSGVRCAARCGRPIMAYELVKARAGWLPWTRSWHARCLETVR